MRKEKEISEDIGKSKKVIITALILLLFSGFMYLSATSNIPFTKSNECKNLMSKWSNVTRGQGQMYSYIDGNCVEYFHPISNYGVWEISLEELRKIDKQYSTNEYSEVIE